MQNINIDDKHAPSLLPDGNWKLAWNDEFDGTELDTTKWFPRLHIMGKRHSTFVSDAYRLDGESNILLGCREIDGHYYSTQLQTGENYMDRPAPPCPGTLQWQVAPFSQPKFMHRFGYYEIRCKLQQVPGWWSAFWMQSPIIGCSPDARTAGVEIDIMENFTRDGDVSHNLHWSGYGPDHKSFGSGSRFITQDGYHYFGFLWTPDSYTFFIDGKESCTTPPEVPISQIDEFILISTECQGYRHGNTASPQLTKAVENDAFVVDFVRVFDKI